MLPGVAGIVPCFESGGAGVSPETCPPKAGDCLLNMRVSSVDAALSSGRHSVLVPVSKRIGWAAVNKQVEELMQGFAHKPEVAIFDSAVGVIPGVESDGVEGAVYQGRINLFRERLPNAAGVQRTMFHELLHYGLRRFMPKEQFIAHRLRFPKS